MARKESRRARRRIYGRTCVAMNTQNSTMARISRGGVRK